MYLVTSLITWGKLFELFPMIIIINIFLLKFVAKVRILNHTEFHNLRNNMEILYFYKIFYDII